MQSLIDYKGLRVLVTLTTFLRDAQQVLGYNNQTEHYIFALPSYPKTYSLVFEELGPLYHVEPKVYDFEEKDRKQCHFPSLKIFHGPERTLADFQNKDKRAVTRVSKQSYDTDTAYIAEVGIMTPPEINFHYNPVMTLQKNQEEYKQGKYKIKPEMMFIGCSAFERWAFEKASQTRTNKRIALRLLLREPFDKKYDLSFINVTVFPNDELLDINLSIKHLFELELYKDKNLLDLVELSNKVFFERLPLLLEDIRRHPMEITDVRRLLRTMASFDIEARHIGIVAVNISYPHIRDMCVEYMAAMAISKILAYTFYEKNKNVSSCVTQLNEIMKKHADIKDPKLGTQTSVNGPLGNKQEQDRDIGDSPGIGMQPKKKDKKSNSNKSSRRSSYKHEDEHRAYVTEFLRTVMTELPSRTRLWEKM